MGIDKQSDVSANIQIGPTDQGMVRIYIEADDGTELPMDFEPDEALDIAEELRAAAEAARTAAPIQDEGLRNALETLAKNILHRATTKKGST